MSYIFEYLFNACECMTYVQHKRLSQEPQLEVAPIGQEYLYDYYLDSNSVLLKFASHGTPAVEMVSCQHNSHVKTLPRASLPQVYRKYSSVDTGSLQLFA